ncbi:MAG TPA: methyltransferase domain-containing protein [Methanosarcina sp.]|nr:methyltransferase domain-containing protein [Methanosarcina sp.]
MLTIMQKKVVAPMKVDNAVDYHTTIAERFDRKYLENKDFIERYEVWTKFISRYAVAGGTALDCGCGSGVFSSYLAEKGLSVVAFDASEEMIRLCRQKTISNSGSIRFLQCKVEEFQNEREDGSDIIVCSSVLEYVEDFKAVLKKLSSLLKAKGLLIFSVPNADSLYRKVEAGVYRVAGFPRYYAYVKNIKCVAELRRDLDAVGLIPVDSQYYGKTSYITEGLRVVLNKKRSDNLLLMVAQKRD